MLLAYQGVFSENNICTLRRIARSNINIVSPKLTHQNISVLIDDCMFYLLLHKQSSHSLTT